MTKQQTLLMATGSPAGLDAMLSEIHALDVETIASLLHERWTLPVPQVNDNCRWTFPGSEPNAFQLAKALSVQYPTLTWHCYVPTDADGEGNSYTLVNGEGTQENRTAVPSHLPDGNALIRRYRVQQKASVLEAAFVIQNNGEYEDVTDSYLGSRPNHGSLAPEGGDAGTGFDWHNEEDINALLQHAHLQNPAT